MLTCENLHPCVFMGIFWGLEDSSKKANFKRFSTVGSQRINSYKNITSSRWNDGRRLKAKARRAMLAVHCVPLSSQSSRSAERNLP